MRVPRLLVSVLLCACLASASDLRQIGMINLPGAPGFGDVAFSGGMLLLTHPGASSLDVFDPVKRRIIAQVTGLQSPRGIAVDDKGSRVYIADHGSNSIAVIATNGWKVVDSIALQGSPDKLLLTGDGKLFWTDADAETLSLLDLHTKQDMARVDLGGRPRDLVADPQRNLVFATLQDAHQIVAITPQAATNSTGDNGGTNAPQLTIAKRITLNASEPTGLIYDPQYRELYVAVRYAVLAISAETGAEVDRVAAPAGVDALWLDADSRLLFAASEGSLTVMSAKGRLAKVDEVATAGIKGHMVAYDAEKRMVLLPGGSEGKSKMLILRPNAQADANDTDARVR
jgi:YVTN family beta-propeller protein